MSSLRPHSYCTCQTEPRLTSQRARSQPFTSSNSTCSHLGSVNHLNVIPTLDVTAEYIGSVELKDEKHLFPLGDVSLNTQDDGTHAHLQQKDLPLRSSMDRTSAHQQQHRGRRHPHRYVSAASRQSLSQSDLEGFSYFFPEDHEPAAQAYSSQTWPTPSGLTEQQAWTQCQQAVANSSIAINCRPLLTEFIVSRTVAMCVSDLQLKDEQSWLTATLPLLENECERRLVEERRREEDYQEALAVLRCPGLCNGNGQCSEWGCVCFPGFGSFDCSVLSGNI